MTLPDHNEREAGDGFETLYCSDREMFRRWGVSQATGRTAVKQFEKAALQGAKPFPARDPLFANKRFWPAVKAFLFEREGLTLAEPFDVEVFYGAPDHHGRAGNRMATPR